MIAHQDRMHNLESGSQSPVGKLSNSDQQHSRSHHTHTIMHPMPLHVQSITLQYAAHSGDTILSKYILTHVSETDIRWADAKSYMQLFKFQMQ